MFVVTVKFELVPGAEAAFMPLMHTQAKNSLELETECHQFDVCTDPEKPGTVFLYELYSDEAAFQLHLASDHFKQFDADVAALVQDKQVQLYQRSYPA